MKNQFGLDVSYFGNKIDLLKRDLSHYTPSELARELARMSRAADEKVLSEPEFATVTIRQNTSPLTINM